MSKTLWNTIKIEVPEKMVNITKNDKVVVKHSLTKTNNISKSNKEPSIKIISGDINKPKIINDGKEWNVEELKITMKKAKDLGKKNEGKEYKNKMTNDKAAKIITKEINSRAKLNRADSYLKEKNEIDKIKDYSRNQLEIIFKKIVGFKNNINFFDKNTNNTLDLKKYTEDELKNKIQFFYKTHKKYKQLYIPEIPTEEKNDSGVGGYSKRKAATRNRIDKNWKHPFLKN